MEFYGLAALEEQRNELVARVEAIVELAKTEGDEPRDLTDDESAEVDSITNEKIPAIDAKIERETKLNEMTAKKLHQRAVEGDDFNAIQTFKVPARARASRKLKAFENEEDAYVAGSLFLAHFYNNEPAKQFCTDRGLFTNVQSGTTGPKGGFLVPEEMQRTLIRLREQYGAFAQYARPYPMASDNLFVPRPISDVTVYWVGQNAEITESDLDLAAAELTAKKIAALCKFSSEIDQDSVVDVGEMLTTSIAYKMAVAIDDAGFNGDGTSTYGGVTGLKNTLVAADPAAGGAGAVVVAESGNDAASNLDMLDFEKTVGAYPEYGEAQPRWFMSKPVYMASYVRLMNALGGSVRSEISGDREPEILGYPVTFTPTLTKTTSTLASTIIAYFGDLSLTATLGTRRGVRTAVSLDRYFEFDQIGIRVDERLAITVHERGASIEQRPMLGLKTAA